MTRDFSNRRTPAWPGGRPRPAVATLLVSAALASACAAASSGASEPDATVEPESASAAAPVIVANDVVRGADLSNDNRANAVDLTSFLSQAMESTVTGSLVGATHDGPSPCVCTDGGNVWYRFTLDRREVIYLDTAGSTYDTSLYVTDTNDNVVGGMCNDNAFCPLPGFNATWQSRVFGVLSPGTYRIAVGGCGTGGNYVLHFQHLPLEATATSSPLSSFTYTDQLSGTGATSTYLVGPSYNASTCGGSASGEDLRWFVACGGESPFFSVCPEDGGNFDGLTPSGGFYDPVLYTWSAQSAGITACNDDGVGHNCVGRNGTHNWGSRLGVMATRGINGIFVDERRSGIRGGIGMTYTLAYRNVPQLARARRQ
jgi:hypothetical protein